MADLLLTTGYRVRLWLRTVHTITNCAMPNNVDKCYPIFVSCEMRHCYNMLDSIGFYSKRSSMTNVRTIKTRLDTLTQKAMPVGTQNSVALNAEKQVLIIIQMNIF